MIADTLVPPPARCAQLTRTLTSLVAVWGIPPPASGDADAIIALAETPSQSQSWQLKEGCLLTYELLIDMLLSSQREHLHPYARMSSVARGGGGGGGAGGGDDTSSVSSADGEGGGAQQQQQKQHSAVPAASPAQEAGGGGGVAAASAAAASREPRTPLRVAPGANGACATPASEPSPWLSPERITSVTRHAGHVSGVPATPAVVAAAAAAAAARVSPDDGIGGSDDDASEADDDVGGGGRALVVGGASPLDHDPRLGSGSGGTAASTRGVFWTDAGASLIDRLRAADAAESPRGTRAGAGASGGGGGGGGGGGVSEALWAMLLQTTACLGEVQFELKRMSDQVLPLLTELLLWYDVGLLRRLWARLPAAIIDRDGPVCVVVARSLSVVLRRVRQLEANAASGAAGAGAEAAEAASAAAGGGGGGTTRAVSTSSVEARASVLCAARAARAGATEVGRDLIALAARAPSDRVLVLACELLVSLRAQFGVRGPREAADATAAVFLHAGGGAALPAEGWDRSWDVAVVADRAARVVALAHPDLAFVVAAPPEPAFVAGLIAAVHARAGAGSALAAAAAAVEACDGMDGAATPAATPLAASRRGSSGGGGGGGGEAAGEPARLAGGASAVDGTLVTPPPDARARTSPRDSPNHAALRRRRAGVLDGSLVVSLAPMLPALMLGCCPGEAWSLLPYIVVWIRVWAQVWRARSCLVGDVVVRMISVVPVLSLSVVVSAVVSVLCMRSCVVGCTGWSPVDARAL